MSGIPGITPFAGLLPTPLSPKSCLSRKRPSEDEDRTAKRVCIIAPGSEEALENSRATHQQQWVASKIMKYKKTFEEKPPKEIAKHIPRIEGEQKIKIIKSTLLQMQDRECAQAIVSEIIKIYRLRSCEAGQKPFARPAREKICEWFLLFRETPSHEPFLHSMIEQGHINKFLLDTRFFAKNRSNPDGLRTLLSDLLSFEKGSVCIRDFVLQAIQTPYVHFSIIWRQFAELELGNWIKDLTLFNLTKLALAVPDDSFVDLLASSQNTSLSISNCNPRVERLCMLAFQTLMENPADRLAKKVLWTGLLYQDPDQFIKRLETFPIQELNLLLRWCFAEQHTEEFIYLICFAAAKRPVHSYTSSSYAPIFKTLELFGCLSVVSHSILFTIEGRESPSIRAVCNHILSLAIHGETRGVIPFLKKFLADNPAHRDRLRNFLQRNFDASDIAELCIALYEKDNSLQ